MALKKGTCYSLSSSHDTNKSPSRPTQENDQSNNANITTESEKKEAEKKKIDKGESTKGRSTDSSFDNDDAEWERLKQGIRSKCFLSCIFLYFYFLVFFSNLLYC